MVNIYVSTIIKAPAGEVWDFLRDFNNHDQWHPAVDKSEIEDGKSSTEVGCVRNFTLMDGSRIREQLISMSDREMFNEYCILEADVPLLNYVARVQLRPLTDGNATFWEWSSAFDTPPGMEDELKSMVENDVYGAGFEAIRQKFERSD